MCPPNATHILELKYIKITNSAVIKCQNENKFIFNGEGKHDSNI